MRLLVLAATAAAVACAPGAVVRQPSHETVPALIDRVIGERGAVPWSDRLLSWDDFTGTAPDQPGDRGAQTAYTIFHAAQCTGDRFAFRVVAAMLPDQSWVAPGVRRDTALSTRTLRHEQTHFDLTEVHARRLRRYFTEIYSPCTRGTSELDELAGRFMREETEAQRRYDAETRYGRAPEPQRAWDADVARELLALDRYADAKTRPASAVEGERTRR